MLRPHVHTRGSVSSSDVPGMEQSRGCGAHASACTEVPAGPSHAWTESGAGDSLLQQLDAAPHRRDEEHMHIFADLLGRLSVLTRRQRGYLVALSRLATRISLKRDESVFCADDPADGTLILLRGRVALAKPTAVASSNGPLKPASPDSDSDKPKVGDCETLGGQRNYSAATVAKSRKWLQRQVSTVLEGDDEGQACDVHPDQSDGLSACVKCQLPTQQCCCEVNASSGSSWTANETRSCEVVLPSQGFEWKEVSPGESLDGGFPLMRGPHMLRQAQARCLENSELLRISTADFELCTAAAEAERLVDTLEKLPESRTSEDMEFIRQVCLAHVPLFAGWDQGLLLNIARTIEVQIWPGHTTLFRKGDQCDALYLAYGASLEYFQRRAASRLLGLTASRTTSGTVSPVRSEYSMESPNLSQRASPTQTPEPQSPMHSPARSLVAAQSPMHSPARSLVPDVLGILQVGRGPDMKSHGTAATKMRRTLNNSTHMGLVGEDCLLSKVRDKTCKVIWGGYLLRVDSDNLQFEMHKFAEQEAKKRLQIITSALDLGRRLHPEVAQKLVGLFSVKKCSHGMVLAEQHGDINDIFILETATCATRLELKFCKAAARPEASSGMSEKSRNEMYAVPNKLMTKYIHLNSAGPMDCLGLTDWASACKAAVEKRRTGGGGHVHLADISAHWIASVQVVNEGTVLVANRHRMMAFLEAYYDGEISLLEALRLQQGRKINARASRIMAGIANFKQHGLVMAQADALFLETMVGPPEEEMVGRRDEVAIQQYMTEEAQAYWWSGVLDIPSSLNKPLPTWADVHRSGRKGRPSTLLHQSQYKRPSATAERCRNSQARQAAMVERPRPSAKELVFGIAEVSVFNDALPVPMPKLSLKEIAALHKEHKSSSTQRHAKQMGSGYCSGASTDRLPRKSQADERVAGTYAMRHSPRTLQSQGVKEGERTGRAANKKRTSWLSLAGETYKDIVYEINQKRDAIKNLTPLDQTLPKLDSTLSLIQRNPMKRPSVDGHERSSAHAVDEQIADTLLGAEREANNAELERLADKVFMSWSKVYDGAGDPCAKPERRPPFAKIPAPPSRSELSLRSARSRRLRGLSEGGDTLSVPLG